MALNQHQNLDLSLKQQLTLTPQLQQAIKILNMSTLDLNLEISQMLSQNFMLEINHEEFEETIAASEASDAETDTLLNQLTAELDYDSNWDEHYDTDWQDHAPYQEDNASFESYTASSQTLAQYLLEQINQMPLEETSRMAAETLIYHLDENGYLREKPAELAKLYNLPLNQIQAGIKAIQNCQPTGIGAADLEECLNLQLALLPHDTPYLDTLKHIMARHFLFIGKNPNMIRQRLGLSEADYDHAIKLLRSLDPRPGLPYSQRNANYITPEIIVHEKHGISYIETGDILSPELSINENYRQLIKHANEQEKALLQAQLNEARWFINAIDKRADTIKRVAGVIVALQQEFFQEGEKAMQPLTRQKVADMLDIHESTVSRAVNGKYLSCKRGLYELRYFFSNQLENSEAGEQSTTAIKAIIAEIISKENPRKPLSDQAITELLEKQGNKIARRTVAKYREELNIPTSSLRRQR